LARGDIGDLCADGSHHTGQFVAECHRFTTGAGEAAEFDVAQVAAADPAGVHVDDGVTRAALGQLDAIEAHLPRRMDSNLVDRSHASSFQVVVTLP
jgi:hypothetical protein